MDDMIRDVFSRAVQLSSCLHILYQWIVTHPMQVLLAMGSWFLFCGMMDWCEYKWGERKWIIYLWKMLMGVVLITTIVMILYVTLFNRYQNEDLKYKLDLFWSYKQVIFYKNKFILWQIMWNILAFVPFGHAVYYLLGTKRSWYKVALVAVVFSTYIELTQLYKRIGLFEFDDIFHNTLGAVIGSLVAGLIAVLPKKTRI